MTQHRLSPEHSTQSAAPAVEPSSAADSQLELKPLEELADCDPRKLPSPPPPRFPPTPETPAEPIRYSLFELLLLMTVTAVMLSTIRLLGAAAFAGIAGVVGFIMLVFISLAKPTRGIVHVAWWVILAIYLIAAVAAVVNKDL